MKPRNHPQYVEDPDYVLSEEVLIQRRQIPTIECNPSPKQRSIPPRSNDGRMPPLTITVSGFQKITGLGRTKTFALLREGKLQKVKVGCRTLITFESVEALIKRSIVREDE